MFTVFIDGDQGTTGLRVRERLAGRKDITLLSLPEEKRKDLDARAAMARQAPGVVTLEAVLEADKEARAFVAGAAH